MINIPDIHLGIPPKSRRYGYTFTRTSNFKVNTLNKILITIQGRTLILYYQVKHALPLKGLARTAYIQVFPSDELSKFNLKGLTPEMFCVNIADMVNFQRVYSGIVENEKQIPVARWSFNYDEYIELINAPIKNLTHAQIVTLLSPLAGFVREYDDQYIDFEERIVSHKLDDASENIGYRLTIATEEIEGVTSTDAYYSLDTYSENKWQASPPAPSDFETIRITLNNKLQLIKEVGVSINQLIDETDYTVTL
jgi:hypothetical protein